MKNITKMLLMYLQDNGVNAHVPNYGNPYRNTRRDEPECIIINLKHADLGETVTLSVMKTEIYIEGTRVFGKEHQRRTYGGYETKDKEIANLADPQALIRIRAWIRDEEKKVKYSASVAQAAARLRISSYGAHTKVEAPNLDSLDAGIEDARSLYGGDIVSMIREFVEEEREKERKREEEGLDYV